MKKLINFLLVSLFFIAAQAQTSTNLAVYQILQEKCATCHNHNNPESGLDLEGLGDTPEERAANVRNMIVGITPNNDSAAGKGYQYIYPGRADRSFLFRKINNNLDENIHLSADAGETMPPIDQAELLEEEKELIRQWILFGAPQEGEVVNPQVIYDYYHVNGSNAFDTPPPAPDPSEGFQIKMGPFFLAPAGQEGYELEYYYKQELDLQSDVDVNRIDMKIGSYSHHLVIYRFNDISSAAAVQPGMRTEVNHSDINIITTTQESADVQLPEGTAFIWDKDIVLDLNTHYINYSANNTHKAEVYVNIYTQPAGTAAQEMLTGLVPYPWIYIPNNGNPISFSDELTYPGEYFIWAMGAHTHKYGTGYKIWERQASGEKGELLYDGSCAGGIPGCVSPFYDYQHIPNRIFQPFLKLDMNKGVIHEATYINDGPNPVWWGPTSNDEMMLFGVMYVEDTTGLNIVSALSEPSHASLEGVAVYPNPASQEAVFTFPPTAESPIKIQLFDVLGNEVRHSVKTAQMNYRMSRGNLPGGMYFYRVTDAEGKWQTGKLFLE